MRNYQQNIIKILHAYPPGSESLVTAFAALCQTVYEHGANEARKSMAESVCEELHVGPAKSVKCMQCYNAEQGFHEVEAIQAEIEALKEQQK